MKHGLGGYTTHGCRCDVCKAAASSYSKEYRARHPKRMADATKRHRDKKRDRIQAVKLERGCQDCGYNTHPAALDFDHVRGDKSAGLAHMWSSTWDKIAEEIEKCEVVCANCHRVRTANRRKEGS